MECKECIFKKRGNKNYKNVCLINSCFYTLTIEQQKKKLQSAQKKLSTLRYYNLTNNMGKNIREELEKSYSMENKQEKKILLQKEKIVNIKNLIKKIN